MITIGYLLLTLYVYVVGMSGTSLDDNKHELELINECFSFVCYGYIKVDRSTMRIFYMTLTTAIQQYKSIVWLFLRNIFLEENKL